MSSTSPAKTQLKKICNFLLSLTFNTASFRYVYNGDDFHSSAEPITCIVKEKCIERLFVAFLYLAKVKRIFVLIFGSIVNFNFRVSWFSSLDSILFSTQEHIYHIFYVYFVLLGKITSSKKLRLYVKNSTFEFGNVLFLKSINAMSITSFQ